MCLSTSASPFLIQSADANYLPGTGTQFFSYEEVAFHLFIQNMATEAVSPITLPCRFSS